MAKSTYKARLCDADVIEEHENSSFSFVVPAFNLMIIGYFNLMLNG